MTTYTMYCKYLCLAAIAGLLVTGMPSQGNAIDLGGTGDAFSIDALLVGASDDDAPTKICGDYKGESCSPNGSTQKCRTKGGEGKTVYYCTQTCNDGKWSSAHDCEKAPKGNGTVAVGGEVLEQF